ncbi:hypothetical protein [Streptomyces sp. NPDC006510]|uniref:hypothetical protein n=1 Tax=Streptomyces sp. NPDC006510 TaxID=3155600 RepID=UPI0033B3952E
MTFNSDRLSAIARSLNLTEWEPTPDEVTFGRAFFRRTDELEEPSLAFPRGPEQGNHLHTEAFDATARKVALVQDELLPAWRERLAGSPMVELAELYVSAAAPLLPHAQRLLTAWRGVALPSPTAEDIARTAARRRISAEQAALLLRFENAAQWEKDTNPRDLWTGLLPVWANIGSVLSTMTAAITRDTYY